MTAAAQIRPAWRCTGCSKLSNAKTKPRRHVRGPDYCGPFEPAQVAPDGAVVVERSNVPTMERARPTTYRQSLLRDFETCPRRALHSLAIPNDLSVGNVGSSADLGSASHAVLIAIINTLRQHGTSLDEHGRRVAVEQLSTQEGIEVMYETLAAGEWVLTAEDRADLRGFVLTFCSEKKYRWQPGRILATERRLHLDIVCPDGKTRRLTGQPDVILADPPDSLIIVDFKTGRGQPSNPRPRCQVCGEWASNAAHGHGGSHRFTPPPDDAPIVGRQYLDSTYQLDIYGLLALRGVDEDGHRLSARARQATLREAWMRFGELREATLTVDELEHVEREVAVQMMLLDRAIDEGPDSGSKLTNPRPGKQCSRACPVLLSCPIDHEQRGDEGAITSPEEADELVKAWVKAKADYQALGKRVKAWHDVTGHCPEVGDGTVARWKAKASGKGRDFGVFEPEVIELDDGRYIEQWTAELEAQQTKAGVAA